MDAKIHPDKGMSLMSQQYLCDEPEVRCVLEGENGVTSSLIYPAEATKQLMQKLFGLEHEVVRYKWIRAIPDKHNTGIHVDRAHLDGPGRLVTVWIPMGDISVRQGNYKCPEFNLV